MHRILRLLTTIVCFSVCIGCSQPRTEGQGEFTRDFAVAIQEADSGHQVEFVRDLEIRVTAADGREATMFLDNAYIEYVANPKEKGTIFQRFISSGLESLRRQDRVFDRDRIVPVIKDRPWIRETIETVASSGVKGGLDYVYDDFNDDLVIVYAVDSPTSISFLRDDQLEKVPIEKLELKAVACANLERLLPKIERHGSNGFYMLTAGGNYEASLLLIDSVWNDGQLEVDGDLVVAIPTRDILLV